MTIRARSSLAALVALSVVLGLALTAPSTASPSDAARKASLSISPQQFYGGQGLRFTGSIGGSGKTAIWLEYHMGRPGDRWTKIENSNRTTSANGSFSFRFPARGMNNISLRVAARGRATPPVRFNAREQGLRVTVDPALEGSEDGTYVVGAGTQITVGVDTSGGPVLAGRAVALQRRAGQQGWRSVWSTVDTSILDSRGRTSFSLSAPGAGSSATYRAVLGPWRKSGSRIGTYPSYPFELRGASAVRPSLTEGSRPSRVRPVAAAGVSPQAFTRYGWGPMLFDFGWEYGEGLEDAPFRGTKKRGKWTDYSTGFGRVAKRNGGMMLDSGFGRVPSGSSGVDTTAMTLTGNPQTYGRWEMRIRPWTTGRGGGDYRIRAEVVPEKYGQYGCGARSIVIADITPNKKEVRFGATTPNGNRAWSGVKKGITIFQSPNAYAVEVARDHITWFVNGAPVGTLKSKAAVPGVPLTLRISMVGDGSEQMNSTYAVMDWVRGWTIQHGKQVRSGPALKAGKHSLSC